MHSTSSVPETVRKAHYRNVYEHYPVSKELPKCYHTSDAGFMNGTCGRICNGDRRVGIVPDGILYPKAQRIFQHNNYQLITNCAMLFGHLKPGKSMVLFITIYHSAY